MNISGDPFSSSLASLASEMKGSQIQQGIAVAVLKQSQDAQEQFAQALIEMMRNGPTLQGTGQIINIAA